MRTGPTCPCYKLMQLEPSSFFLMWDAELNTSHSRRKSFWMLLKLMRSPRCYFALVTTSTLKVPGLIAGLAFAGIFVVSKLAVGR